MTRRRLKFWGWGYENEGLDRAETQALIAFCATLFNVDEFISMPPPSADEIELPEPRLKPPASLSRLCSFDHYERLVHACGKSFRDSARMFVRDVPHAPDVVAFPQTEADIQAMLDWAGNAEAAVIPFGGGSSVVGGVEGTGLDDYKGVVAIDLTGLDDVLEIDKTSRAARIQAGIRGPALEGKLRAHGLTLRHFPQSFAMATLGGWIATRSGGHFSTLYTHIDEFVESLRMVSPAGIIQSRRLPGSGAGPSPDRFVTGSEGSFGIVTEAWMRLQDRPRFRASAALTFEDFFLAANAVRAIAQSGLNPANCRLVDATECAVTGLNDGSAHLLVLGFESADHTVDPALARAVEIARDHGAAAVNGRPGAASQDAVAAWRKAFIRMPFNRDVLTGLGVIADTFESAVPWDQFEVFHSAVVSRTSAAIEEVTGRPGIVSCRFTHVYPDGPAPYYGFHALGDRNRLIDQWWHIKRAASDAVFELGGTITHHHAIGRDHMPWYERQRPELFGTALRAAKSVFDPNNIMNPGVIVGRG